MDNRDEQLVKELLMKDIIEFVSLQDLLSKIAHDIFNDIKEDLEDSDLKLTDNNILKLLDNYKFNKYNKLEYIDDTYCIYVKDNVKLSNYTKEILILNKDSKVRKVLREYLSAKMFDYEYYKKFLAYQNERMNLWYNTAYSTPLT